MNLEMCVTGDDCYGSGTRAILYPFCQVCEAMPTTKRVPKLLSCNRVKYLNFEKSCGSVLKPESLHGLMSLPKTAVWKTLSFAVLVEDFQGGIFIFISFLNGGVWLIYGQTWTSLQNKNKSTLICIPGKVGGGEWKGFSAAAVWMNLICTSKSFLVVNML